MSTFVARRRTGKYGRSIPIHAITLRLDSPYLHALTPPPQSPGSCSADHGWLLWSLWTEKAPSELVHFGVLYEYSRPIAGFTSPGVLSSFGSILLQLYRRWRELIHPTLLQQRWGIDHRQDYHDCEHRNRIKDVQKPLMAVDIAAIPLDVLHNAHQVPQEDERTGTVETTYVSLPPQDSLRLLGRLSC